MKEMVEQFQCPGCVSGSDTTCGKFNYSVVDRRCTSHILGTSININNSIALGLPKGFNKPGWGQEGKSYNKIMIRLYENGQLPEWDHLNVPVWALEKDGFLFVRTYAPRINQGWVDVIENGTLGLCSNAIDVSSFIDEID